MVCGGILEMNICNMYGTVYNEPLVTFDEENGEIIKCSYLLLVNDSGNSDMIPIHCYGKVAGFANNNLKKGMRVAVTGRLKNLKTEDDGYKLIVVAIKNEFDDGRNREESNVVLPLG